MRNLPAVVAGSALDAPITPVHAVSNLQDGFEENGIARIAVLALPRVAEGGRVVRVEPNTTLGELLVDVLGPALADRRRSLDLQPLDPDGGRSPRISCLGAR